MKTKTPDKMSLKKLTIAKINLSTMETVKGGSSQPSSMIPASYCLPPPW